MSSQGGSGPCSLHCGLQMPDGELLGVQEVWEEPQERGDPGAEGAWATIG